MTTATLQRLHHVLGVCAFAFVLVFAVSGLLIVHVRWGSDEQGLDLSPSATAEPKAAAERTLRGTCRALDVREDTAMDWRRKERVDVYAVRMDDRAGSTVYVDRTTGDFVNLMNRRRDFILWANRLHRLDYFGPASTWALDAACALLIALSVSGMALAWKLRRPTRGEESPSG